jgi:hypothetical protein
MAIRAQDYALADFTLNLFCTPRFQPFLNCELLGRRIYVMKIKTCFVILSAGLAGLGSLPFAEFGYALSSTFLSFQ